MIWGNFLLIFVRRLISCLSFGSSGLKASHMSDGPWLLATTFQFVNGRNINLYFAPIPQSAKKSKFQN